MRKFRVVLDTNILLAALITKGTGPDLIYQLLQRGKFDLVTSEFQLNELKQVVKYPRIAARIKPEEVRAMLNYLRAKAVLATENKSATLSPDPKDNPILAIALNGGAKYIVSRDKPHVLALFRVTKVALHRFQPHGKG